MKKTLIYISIFACVTTAFGMNKQRHHVKPELNMGIESLTQENSDLKQENQKLSEKYNTLLLEKKNLADVGEKNKRLEDENKKMLIQLEILQKRAEQYDNAEQSQQIKRATQHVVTNVSRRRSECTNEKLMVATAFTVFWGIMLLWIVREKINFCSCPK